MSSEIKVDTISENTSANGVAIDSVTLKDGGITTTGAVGIGTSSLQPFLVNGARGSGMGSYPTWETTTGRNLALFETDQSEGSFVLGSPTNGYAQLGFADPASKASGRVGYDHSSDAMIFGTNGGTEAMRIDSAGHITMPLQPAFQVHPASNQDNVSSGVQVVFGTERFDVNGDFASNTFTAPVTGKYQLQTNLYLSDFDASADYLQADIVTSNNTYSTIWETGSEDSYVTLNIACTADMDASDTAYVRLFQGSGAAQVDIRTAARFSGHLAC